ncbi:hypothetical protein ACROYT_G014346 [Oculina patagonica]
MADNIVLLHSPQDCVFNKKQKRHVVLVDQPLKGLVPEELCSSSSSETSQIRGSSEESYSILQERSSPGGNAPDVSIVASSQNSHEFEIEQPLSHVTPERTQFHCSLSESQLGKLFDSSVSFDEVTSPPCISDGLLPMQEGFTQIKPRDMPLLQRHGMLQGHAIAAGTCYAAGTRDYCGTWHDAGPFEHDVVDAVDEMTCGMVDVVVIGVRLDDFGVVDETMVALNKVEVVQEKGCS